MCVSPKLGLNGTGLRLSKDPTPTSMRPNQSASSLSTLSEDQPWKEDSNAPEPGPDPNGVASRRPPSGIFSGAGDCWCQGVGDVIS